MESEWNPSTLVLLSAISQRTERIRMGTNVTLTPFYNPIRLAEDASTIDILSHGRFDLVCGTASITGEFNTFGIDPNERHGRTFETLEFLRRYFSEDKFDHHGRYFNFPNVRTTTHPVQDPFPLWFGGFGPKNLGRAGRLGFHGASASPAYYAGLKEGGHDPKNFNSCGTVSIITVRNEREIPEAKEFARIRTEENVREYTQDADTKRDLAFENFQSTHGRDNSDAEVETAPRALVIGTPDHVLEAVQPLFKDSQATHVLAGMVGHLAVRGVREHPEWVELFLREVAPTMRTWGRQPVGR
jgi:alkanesulfonate monooxygenase SsuD/methylene tetrahydromethanopterin reductase-like flavin-dependent oxidoreductase (luciferase family)